MLPLPGESIFLNRFPTPTGAVTGKALTAHGGPTERVAFKKIEALPRASLTAKGAKR